MARKRSGISVIPSNLLDIRVGSAQVPIYGASSVTENAEASTTTAVRTYDGIHNEVTAGGAGTVTIEIASLVEGEDWINFCEDARKNNSPVHFTIYSRGAYLFPDKGVTSATTGKIAWTSAKGTAFTPTNRYVEATITQGTGAYADQPNLQDAAYHVGHAIWVVAAAGAPQATDIKIHTIQALLDNSETKLGLDGDTAAQTSTSFAIVRPCLRWKFDASITQLTILPSFSADEGAVANGTLEVSPISRIDRPVLHPDPEFYA